MIRSNSIWSSLGVFSINWAQQLHAWQKSSLCFSSNLKLVFCEVRVQKVKSGARKTWHSNHSDLGRFATCQKICVSIHVLFWVSVRVDSRTVLTNNHRAILTCTHLPVKNDFLRKWRGEIDIVMIIGTCDTNAIMVSSHDRILECSLDNDCWCPNGIIRSLCREHSKPSLQLNNSGFPSSI